MNRLIANCMVLLFASCVVVSTYSQKPFVRLDGADDTSEYRKLVEKLKSGDLTIDFVKFRAAFLQWTLDECNVTRAPNRNEMVKAFDAKEYAKAIKIALSVLDYEYANRGLHLAIANAYRETGDGEKAKFHTDIADLLLKGLLNSGDGKTPKTAYRVHTIREEYAVMRELGYTVGIQSLVFDKEYGTFDVLSGKNKDGKEGSFYFNITDIWIGSNSSKPCKTTKT